MRARTARITAVFLLIITVVFCSAISAAALDDTYRFDEFGFSIKFPKTDYVITRDSSPDDEAFAAVGLDYYDTMTAFKVADIYLHAYDQDKTYQISLTVTADENTEAINNYSDLTTTERKEIVDKVLENEGVSSAVEVKHNGSIFIDSQRQTTLDGKDVYINLSNTIINGMQIDLTLQKYDEPITADEAKALTNAANSINFEKIKRNTGATFEWWRILLWIGLLAGLTVAITIIYRQYNAANKRKMEERRKRHNAKPTSDPPEPAHAESTEMTFEESLGYQDEEEFTERADADEMAGYDIKVRERDPAKGIAYFEDEGSGINDGTDYFDTYFKEPTEKRTAIQRFFSSIGYYIRYAFVHTGYFFKNLFTRKKKK